MAFKIGTASDHWGLLYDLIDFITTDPALVGAGHNWAIEEGQISDQVVEYLNGSSFGTARYSNWCPQVALGDSDYWSEHRRGWNAYQADIGNGDAYLGFEAKAPVRPTYYKMRTPYFNEASSDERPRLVTAWHVQYSDDGSTWVTLQSDTWSSTSRTSEEEKTFQMPLDNNDPDNIAPRKYWRILVTANGGDSTDCQLGRLRFYDASDNWVSYRNGSHYVVRGPGMDGNSEIYSHLWGLEYLQLGHAWIGSRSYRAWDVTQLPNDQTLPSQWVYTNLWPSETPYWFIANGQRFIIAAKVSTTFALSYNGKFYPYGTPSEYPYPVIVSGHDDYPQPWTRGDAYNLSIQNPGDGTQLFTPQNEWWRWRGREPVNNESWGRTETGPGYCYAFHNYYYSFAQPNLSTSGTPFTNILPNADGSVCTFPYILFQYEAPVNGVLGELDGIRFVYAYGMVSEDVVTIDGTDYLAIQNVFRTDEVSFCLLELK